MRSDDRSKKPAGIAPRRVRELLPLLAEFITRPQAGYQIGAIECCAYGADESMDPQALGVHSLNGRSPQPLEPPCIRSRVAQMCSSTFHLLRTVERYVE